MTPYIFIRDTHFYVVELHNDEDAKENAKCNPGTTRVEDLDGRIVWKIDDD